MLKRYVSFIEHVTRNSIWAKGRQVDGRIKCSKMLYYAIRGLLFALSFVLLQVFGGQLLDG